MGKRERKARERERKRNIVALLLLLLLRRTAATVLEHVLPVLFALSFLGPTHTHWLISVHFFLVFLVFSVYPTNACSRYSYWWWWRVPSLLPPLLPIKLPLASTRTKRDFGRWRLCPPALGKTIPARGRRRGRERRRRSQSGKGKGKENPKRESAFEASSVLQHAKRKERERERSPSKERSRNCRFCNEVFPFSRTNPSVAESEHHRREKARARIVSRNYK